MLKKRYILTAVALIALIIGLSTAPSSFRSSLRSGALEVAGPVIRLVSYFHSFYSNVDVGFQTLDAAQKEVVRLHEENNRLKTENNFFHDLASENARLREMLDYKKDAGFELLACHVVSRDPSNWWNTILIDRGWEKNPNLTSDLPVVSPRGVVGKTGTVSRSVTEVILMIDENCKISGSIEGTHEQGIVVGEGNIQEGKPKARMKFLARNANLAVGERVFTSGLGGVFPANLMLGTISEVPPLDASVNFGLYREVVIEPAVDLTQLNELFIVLGPK